MSNKQNDIIIEQRHDNYLETLEYLKDATNELEAVYKAIKTGKSVILSIGHFRRLSTLKKFINQSVQPQ